MKDYIRLIVCAVVAIAAMWTANHFKPVHEKAVEVVAVDAAQLEIVEETEKAPLLDPMIEDTYLRDDIPLTYEEQRDLYGACLEFEVPYNIMLGLIEKETRFQNINGDSGNSIGYCQIQPKWHSERMKRINASDLTVAKDNFRTACSIMHDLIASYSEIEAALTAYNRGHYSGTVSQYAKDVMNNAEKY